MVTGVPHGDCAMTYFPAVSGVALMISIITDLRAHESGTSESGREALGESPRHFHWHRQCVV
jgi:hypothetical protein